jgi:hypothetical protein
MSLERLESGVRHEALWSCFIFPRTYAMTDNKSIFTVKYKCVEDKCDFTEAVRQIKQNADLLAYKCKEDVLSIVDDIESHQSKYAPHILDGYVISRGCTNIVKLENERKKDTLTGFVELHDYKRTRLRFMNIAIAHLQVQTIIDFNAR